MFSLPDKKPVKASEKLAAKPQAQEAAKPQEAPLLKPQEQAKPKSKFKETLTLVGAILGGLSALYLAFTFYVIGTAKEGTELSIIGAGTPAFLNGLVVGVYIVLFLAALVTCVWVIIPLFKMLLAKKEEVDKKKKAKKHVIIAGILLGVLLIAWGTAFVYLENRRDVLKINVVHAPIETEPSDTLQLSAPVTIKFDATHAEIDPQNYRVVLYNWDFGDEESEIGDAIVTHEFTQKGSYIVTLTIEKRNVHTGETAKDTHTKEVSITNQSLTAAFTVEPQAGEAPLEAIFDASDSIDPDGRIGKYEWDIDGDGQFEEEYENQITVEHTFEKIGNYEVFLRITSLTGEDYETTKKQVIVTKGETPAAIIEVQGEPATYETGVSYIFKGGESVSPNGDILAYSWDFDDGSAIEDTKTVSHTFDTEGVYNVILTVTDEEDKEGESLLEIVIGTKPGTPQAKMTTDPALEDGALAIVGDSPLTISFDGSVSTDSDENILEYEWDFDNDGEVDEYGKKSSHTYIKEGTHTARLTVTDADNNVGTTTIGIQVSTPGIKAKLTAEPINGEVPLTVKFDSTGSSHPGAEISSYKWDFGDGTSPTLGSGKISHKYIEIGEYTAIVTAIGSDNTKATEEVYITVRAVQVSACFDASPKTGVAPLKVSLDPDCSTGTITGYNWAFGDGSSAAEVKPEHEFDKPGVYPVTLEVSDNDNNVSSTTMNVTVTAE
ncbi:PKD domain-containing protein [Candidatus Peregrinibacteria bacterium]|jgi:large repetitive protein|nr:PKD domain-containing protein [Candidatus Peregrinibacteria bacterium]MBT4055507.1 PKD domain-containing protein [Candidatus Peregrinibacteria bacterium]